MTNSTLNKINDLLVIERCVEKSEIIIHSKNYGTIYEIRELIWGIYFENRPTYARVLKDVIIFSKFQLTENCFDVIHHYYMMDSASIYLCECQPDKDFVKKMGDFVKKISGNNESVNEDTFCTFYFDDFTRKKISKFDSKLIQEMLKKKVLFEYKR